MRCLDENAVVEFVQGGLNPAVRAEIIEHLDDCDACRELVARTSEALVPTGPASAGAVASGADLQRLARGARVDRYRIIDLVGAGAMGMVYAAEDTVLRRSVALKVVRSHPGKTDNPLRVRLLREARAACAVRHPHVVPVHDVLELEDGSPVLVMDLLTGETLRSRLEREHALTVDLAVGVFLQVLSALEAAHTMGVVHRDLKPENIFLCATADGALDVRIVDFGVAKLTVTDSGRAETAGLTETGAMVGTPYYMSPEQAFGEKDIDGRADLWAVGVMLYECMARRRPTEASNVGQVLKALAHLSIRPLVEVAPEVPAPMARLVGDLLCERDRRIQTASEVRIRLEEVLNDPSPTAALAASGVNRQPRTSAWTARTLRGSGIAVASLCAAVGALWFGSRTPPSVRDQLAATTPVEGSVADSGPVAPRESVTAIPQLPATTSVQPPQLPADPIRAKAKERALDAGAPPSPSTPAVSASGPAHLLMTPPF